jgi:branched-chain amino acid transport system substrate-binding protein
MKRIFIGLTCIFGSLLFIMPASSAEQSPYVVGIAIDLTGPAAGLGIPAKRQYEMMVDEYNETKGVNGRQIKLVILDNESKPAKAVLNTKKLINVDKAIAILGYSSTGTILASTQTAAEGETMLVSNAASEKIWKPTQKWIFNVVPSQEYACTPLLIENLLKRGAKNLAYIYIDTAYGQTGQMTFEQACKNKGIEPAIITKYTPGTTDVTPQITHIKNSGADGLIICGYMGDTAMVLKTAKDMGIEFPIVSEYAIVGNEFIELAGTYGEGLVTTSLKALVAHDLPDEDIQKAIAVDLYDNYTEKYEFFSLYAGHAWDSLMLLRKALEKIDSGLDPSQDKDLKTIRTEVRNNFENLQNIVGQNGVFSYSPDNHNGLPYGCYVPVIIKNGTWKLSDF